MLLDQANRERRRSWWTEIGRSPDELFDRGARESSGRVLRGLATRRFGEETGGRVSKLLEELSDPEDIGKVSDALIDCRAGEKFIERVRAA